MEADSIIIIIIIIIIMLYSDWELHDMSWMIEWEHKLAIMMLTKLWSHW